MDDELELPEEVDQMLGKGVIDISQELGTVLPINTVVTRINHHFQHQDLGYRPVSGDTFKLRVRSREYPWLGSFIGQVHIYEKIGHHSTRHVYAMEGLLQFRVSVLWFLSVFAGFFLLTYLFPFGLWAGAVFLAVGTGIVIATTYQLGRNQRDEAEERVEAAFLQLRAVIANLR